MYGGAAILVAPIRPEIAGKPDDSARNRKKARPKISGQRTFRYPAIAGKPGRKSPARLPSGTRLSPENRAGISGQSARSKTEKRVTNRKTGQVPNYHLMRATNEATGLGGGQRALTPAYPGLIPAPTPNQLGTDPERGGTDPEPTRNQPGTSPGTNTEPGGTGLSPARH